MNRKAVLERTLGKKAAKKFLPETPKNQASSPVSLEIESNVIEQIVLQELVYLRTSLMRDLKDRKAGKRSRSLTSTKTPILQLSTVISSPLKQSCGTTPRRQRSRNTVSNDAPGR